MTRGEQLDDRAFADAGHGLGEQPVDAEVFDIGDETRCLGEEVIAEQNGHRLP